MGANVWPEGSIPLGPFLPVLGGIHVRDPDRAPGRCAVTKLQLAKGLALPHDAVTQTFAILAQRGAGKTHCASVLAEEMLGAELPLVVIDPVGVWWGLRSSADGKKPGYAITILGGEHGDVPLEATAGAVIADFVVQTGQPCVLDLSSFRKADQVRFMTSFAERLYTAKARARTPLHVIVDEADAYCPQRPMPGEQRLLGAMEDLVRRGRSRGIGITLITQRAAVLNKNVLTQIGCLVVLRMTAPQDRAAMQDWVRANGTPEQQATMLDSLASLPIGDAWFWSPGWLDGLFKRVHIRARTTFDSSSTPKTGGAARAPRKFAAVDLERLQVAIADTIERATADDPKALRAKVARLEAELKVERARTAPVPPHVVDLSRPLQMARELVTVLSTTPSVGQVAGEPFRGLAKPARAERPSGVTHEMKPGGSVRTTHIAPDGQRLAGGERKILTILAQYPEGRTKVQIALMAEYAHSGGGFNNYLSALRTRGLIEGRGESLQITDAGRSAIGPVEQLPTGSALRERWEARLGKAERSILQALSGGETLSKADLAEVAGYEPSGGGFNNALSRLRTLELISGRGDLRISEDLR